jgi:excisionase family DNA binding protein
VPTGAANPVDDRWLSVDEIVAYLGVSRDTVYNWIATRGMPAHRVGRLWKFKKEAVDAWVQSGGADAVEGAANPEGGHEPAKAPTKPRGGRSK